MGGAISQIMQCGTMGPGQLEPVEPQPNTWDFS